MQAEERLLKQLGLQQAAADAAAKQRASVSGMSTRRRSSSIAAREATVCQLMGTDTYQNLEACEAAAED